MPDGVIIAVGIVGGIVVIWIALIWLLWAQQRRAGADVDWRSMLRLVPDVIRLVKRLGFDPTIPRGVRWCLVALLAYLLLPFDIVPDFIPVLGFADDAIVIAIALRFAIRHAGMDAVTRHWPGDAEGLSALVRLAALRP